MLMAHRTPAVVLLLAMIAVPPCSASNPQYTQLVSDLFSSYVKEIRPAINHRQPTQGGLSLNLKAIDDLEERNQIFVTSVTITVGYIDQYLSWRPADYGGLTYLIYPQQHMWLPDLVVENSVEDMGQLGYNDMTVSITYDGKVIWSPRAVLRTTCNIDVTYYPFDTQTCSIILSTLTSTSDDITLKIDLFDNVQLDGFQESGTWELLSTDIVDISGPSSKNRISFDFHIKRRKPYYVLNLLVPVISLCATASLVFALPAEAGEKVGMSITVLLAYAVYLTIISESMPRTSLQVSIMGVYLSILLGATALAVVFTVLVLHIHHKDDEHPPGNRCRSFTIKLRPFIGLRDLREEPEEDKTRDKITKSPVMDMRKHDGHDDKPNKRNSVSSIFYQNKVALARSRDPINPQDPSQKKPIDAFVVEDKEPEPTVLWRHVSETVDRLLFIVFTLFTVLSSFVFICFLSFGV